jgi:hypothetical protein
LKGSEETFEYFQDILRIGVGICMMTLKILAKEWACTQPWKVSMLQMSAAMLIIGLIDIHTYSQPSIFGQKTLPTLYKHGMEAI